MEQWRDIHGYESLYQVSNMGKIRSLRSGIRLINPNNHTHVCLYDQWGKPSYRKVCRIVAETFLPRKRKCNYVYHINQIPYDNRAENLRWATLRECHRDFLLVLLQILTDLPCTIFTYQMMHSIDLII